MKDLQMKKNMDRQYKMKKRKVKKNCMMMIINHNNKKNKNQNKNKNSKKNKYYSKKQLIQHKIVNKLPSRKRKNINTWII